MGKLKIGGVDVELPVTEPIVVSPDTEVAMDFKWDTEGLDVKNGDTASMTLPDIFKQVTLSNRPLIIEGIEIGKYSIVNGIVMIVFNENLASGNVQNGYLNLGFFFDLEKFKDNIEQSIDVNDESNTSIPVIMRPTGNVEGIDKKGTPDNILNAKEITWEIDVVNTTDKPLTLAQVLDQLPEGLGEPRDFVVHELGVKLDGTKVQGDQVAGTFEAFPISFENIAPFSGYRIKYTTTIEDQLITEFTNNATFEYDGEKLPAKSTVNVQRSNPIEKSGKVKDENTIDWSIDINKAGAVINNATIQDKLPKGVTVVPGTIVVLKNNTPIDPQPTEFPMELGNIAADEVYQINYQTKVDYSEFNDGEYQKVNKITNTAELWVGGEEPISSADDTVEITRQPILEKTGKSDAKYDPSTHTLTWTVTINKAKHPLGNVTLTDIIPEGLKILEDQIKVEGTTKKPTIKVDGQTFTVNFEDLGTDTATITYVTSITDITKAPFKNKAGLTGDGVGEGGKDITKPVTPSPNTFAKAGKTVDYKEQTIDWEIKVNPIYEGINKLVLTDTFPSKGMITLPDSFKVTLKNHDPVELVKGTHYKVEANAGGYQKGFTLEMLVPVKGGELVVTYKTSFDPEKEVDGNVLEPHVPLEGDPKSKYTNLVKVTGTTETGKSVNEDRPGSVNVNTETVNSGKKSGRLVHLKEDGTVAPNWISGAERFIEWDVFINYKGVNLGTGVSLTDTLAYEGEIIQNSVIVQEYEVAAGGGTTAIGSPLELGTDYTIAGSGKTLTVNFTGEVTKRYMVRFRTSVPDISAATYTNNAVLKANDKEFPYESTVNYGESQKFVTKGPVGLTSNQVYIGDQIDWAININDGLSVIHAAVITDTISEGHVYLNDSMKVFALRNGVEVELVQGIDYGFTSVGEGPTTLTITMTEPLSEKIILKYSTIVVSEGQINNTVALSGKNIDKKEISSNKLTASQFANIGGEWDAKKGAIEITKVDAKEDKTIANNEATFELSFKVNGKYIVLGEFKTTKGILRLGNLTLGEYSLREVKAPNGYVTSEEVIEFEVKALGNDQAGLVKRTFENTKKRISITGKKVWEGGPQTKPEVELQLLKNGAPEGTPVKVNGSEKPEAWTHVWDSLEETNIDGKPHVYTIKEVTVPENYESSHSKGGSTITVTNKYVMPKVDVAAQKIWADAKNQDGKRPESVTIHLLANKTKTGKTVVLDADNLWTNQFTSLDKLDKDFKEIEYTLKEDGVAEYTTSINNDDPKNVIITNTHEVEMINLTGKKTWDDANNQDGKRPDSITVVLLSNGNEIDRVDVTEADKWEYSFTALPKYEAGKEITYAVQEVAIAEYSQTIEGMNITNKYTPKKTSLNVVKAWDDANNQDGERPEEINVTLVADGVPTDKVLTLNAENNWQGDFTDLDEFKAGNLITYTVKEEKVPGYKEPVYEETETGITITNSYVPELVEVSITKEWRDGNNQDGNRPESIVVELYKGGLPTGDIQTIKVDDKGNWKGLFTDLDKYEQGELITYHVQEVGLTKGYTAEGYSAEVLSTEKTVNDFTIVNTYIPEVLNLSVTKVWNDEGNLAGFRPAEITVKLLADSKEVQTKVLSEDNAWTHDFTALPKYKDGTEIEYTIEEVAVAEYESTITSDKETPNDFTITNTHNVERIDLSGKKTWNDADNQDGIRPESITINLLANGTIFANAVVTAGEDGQWSYGFTSLPKYKDGKVIDYTFTEEEVTGYEPTINGLDITNTHKPEELTISVTKSWNDEENLAGFRPAEITVKLLADSKEVQTKVLSEDNAWTHDFTGLPKYKDGTEIEYTIKEVPVAEYESTITSDKEKPNDFTITNTHNVERIELSGKKTWNDANNQDGVRPESIMVYLLANEEVVSEAEVKGGTENIWSYSFKDLPKYKDGKEITYTVSEGTVDEYEAAFKGMNITNTHTPGITSINVTKSWDDQDNKYDVRPDSITIKLLADGEATDQVLTLTAKDNWTGSFTDLPINKAGKKIEYTLEEVKVAGYKTKINETELGQITNTLDTVDVFGEKIWNDKDDAWKKRPNAIVVNLLQNGKKIATQEVISDQAGKWFFTFTDLPKSDKEGKEFKYTVTENDVDQYNSTVDGNLQDGFVVTNTRKTYAIGDYTWIDEDKDGIQDAEEEILAGVIVELYDEAGKKVDETTTNEEGLYIFDELESGNYTIKFILTEKQKEFYEFTKQDSEKDDKVDSDADELTGWTTTIKLNDDNTELTKEYEGQEFKATEGIDPTWDAGVVLRKKIEVTGTKVWVGGPAVKPTIELQLYRNDVAFGKPVTLKDGTTTYTWKDLYETDTNKKAYVYTVQEVGTPSEYNKVEDGLTVTNTRKTYAIGDYTWIDTNKDGIQDKDEPVLPGVKVELFDEEGKKVAETTTDENGRYIFDELESGKYKVKFTLTDEQKKRYKFTGQNTGTTTDDSDADNEGWTIDIDLNEKSAALTKEYQDQAFKATEGIDPTWDAGVVLLDIPVKPTEPTNPKDPKPNKPSTTKPLPQTGEAESSILLTSLGILLIGSVAGVTVTRRRRKG